ncbi:hypothetical protein [Mycobacterium kyorinense]|uniref:hypothetical protein n=1 Tax=Mycobacterium kyorinense TaxID=487514 RepID=UPI001F35E58B|nr:hypothetical protein [Mycobacterium kyorinense]
MAQGDAHRYNRPPWCATKLQTSGQAVDSNSEQRNLSKASSSPWYRKPAVLLGLVVVILLALIVWGIIALFTGNQGGAPSTTTTTTPTTMTTTPTTTSTSGGFQLPSLPSKITLPSEITLPSTVITLPSLPWPSREP